MKPPLQSALDPGGPDAELLSQLSWVLIIGGGVIFVIVMALLALALRRSHRERRDPRRTRAAPPASSPAPTLAATAASHADGASDAQADEGAGIGQRPTPAATAASHAGGASVAPPGEGAGIGQRPTSAANAAPHGDGASGTQPGEGAGIGQRPTPAATAASRSGGASVAPPGEGAGAGRRPYARAGTAAAPPGDGGSRAAPGEGAARRWLLLAGAGIPAILLSALLAFSIARTGELTAQSSLTPLRITIIAHMWWWEIRYYDASTGREAVLANELHIPAGAKVYLALTSADVIHAFWLPSLAGKVDMVPGRQHNLTLRADRPGIYRGQCAEYCGAQHAKMALHLTVEDQRTFDAWLANQAAPVASASAAPAATAADAAQLARGRAAFLSARCTACHSIRGLDEQPIQGAPQAPDLTHIGSRQTIAAGALPLHKGTLTAWIADPQAIKPGARMPPASIDAASVNDIAAWLETLK